MTPELNVVASTRLRGDLGPSLKSRFPLPKTTGYANSRINRPILLLSHVQVHFMRDDPDGPDEIPRGWIIWHVIEHDLHHGGEFSYSLGALGLAGLNLP